MRIIKFLFIVILSLTIHGCNSGGSGGKKADLNTIVVYTDSDGDGFGLDGTGQEKTEITSGFALLAGDCNDTDKNIYPKAIDIAGDGIDQDCSGADTALTGDIPGSCTINYFADVDADGFGDINALITQEVGCEATGIVTPPGYAIDSSDCDDTQATINPSIAEIAGDSIDQNCDGNDLAVVSPPEDGDPLPDVLEDPDRKSYLWVSSVYGTANNKCSYTEPCQSIQKAIPLFNPKLHKAILVGGGIYRESIILDGIAPTIIGSIARENGRLAVNRFTHPTIIIGNPTALTIKNNTHAIFLSNLVFTGPLTHQKHLIDINDASLTLVDSIVRAEPTVGIASETLVHYLINLDFVTAQNNNVAIKNSKLQYTPVTFTDIGQSRFLGSRFINLLKRNSDAEIELIIKNNTIKHANVVMTDPATHDSTTIVAALEIAGRNPADVKFTQNTISIGNVKSAWGFSSSGNTNALIGFNKFNMSSIETIGNVIDTYPTCTSQLVDHDSDPNTPDELRIHCVAKPKLDILNNLFVVNGTGSQAELKYISARHTDINVVHNTFVSSGFAHTTNLTLSSYATLYDEAGATSVTVEKAQINLANNLFDDKTETNTAILDESGVSLGGLIMRNNLFYAENEVGQALDFLMDDGTSPQDTTLTGLALAYPAVTGNLEKLKPVYMGSAHAPGLWHPKRYVPDANSPALNAGTSILNLDPHQALNKDLLGNPRTAGPAPDMGAYEAVYE